MREFNCAVLAAIATALYQKPQSQEQDNDGVPEQSREDAETAQVERQEDKNRLIWANW